MRLFLALWPPIEAAVQLAEIARTNAERFGGRPTRQETIHLTLSFLGDVPEAKVPLLVQIMSRIRTAPFDLDFDRIGYWHHNHLLWVGSTSASAALGELISQLRAALAEAGFTIDDAKRGFTPHLTLLRKVPESGSPFELPTMPMISWHCSSFALVRSETSEAGSAYETISNFPLLPF